MVYAVGLKAHGFRSKRWQQTGSHFTQNWHDYICGSLHSPINEKNNTCLQVVDKRGRGKRTAFQNRIQRRAASCSTRIDRHRCSPELAAAGTLPPAGSLGSFSGTRCGIEGVNTVYDRVHQRYFCWKATINRRKKLLTNEQWKSLMTKSDVTGAYDNNGCRSHKILLCYTFDTVHLVTLNWCNARKKIKLQLQFRGTTNVCHDCFVINSNISNFSMRWRFSSTYRTDKTNNCQW